MQFLWSELLWLLLVVPALIGAYVYALRRKKKTALRYASLMLVRDALGRSHAWRRHVPPALFLLAMVAAILGIARPRANITLPSEYMTLILAMDVSRSMQASDVSPNRITAAQAAVKSFVEALPHDLRVGLVSFAGAASVVQTPTENREDLIAAIDRFELQRGTATGSGLLVSLAQLLPDAGIDLESAVFDSAFSRFGGSAAAIDRPHKNENTRKKLLEPVPPGSYTSGAIVLLSDGRRTTGPDPIEAAKLAADLGVRVYTVGFGTKDGGMIGDGQWAFYVRLDEDTLKTVASITGAEYYYAGTAADLRKVYERLMLKFGLERKETEIGALFSAVAAMLLMLAALLSMLWFRRQY